MTGEINLDKLLRSMSPKLIEGNFVFLSVANAKYGDHSELKPFAAITEAEGLTLIVEQALAKTHGFKFDCVYKGITLEVHSSLEAVGLTAAFARVLGEVDISANVIAGFYHDHIFVQRRLAAQAMEALRTLSADSKSNSFVK